MAIGGPRLDRPSAVGDEGRPRGASLTIMAIVVIAVLAAAGLLVGRPLFFSSVALFVGCTSVGLVLLTRERLGPLAVGHLLFLPSAVIMLALVAASGLLTLSIPGLLFLVSGALLAMFGVAAGWNDGFDGATIRTALVSSGLSYVFWLIGLFVVLILWAIGWGLQTVVLGLTRGSGPVASLFGLFGLVGLASVCLYIAVRTVPAIQLTPARRRDAARARYATLRSRLVYLSAGAWGLMAVAIVGFVAGVVQQLLALPPIGSLVVVLSALTAIPLAFVAVLSLLIALVAWAARRATSGFESVSTRTVGAALGASGYMIALVMAIPVVLRLGTVGVAPLLLLPALPILVYVVLAVVWGGFYVGVIPDRAGAAAAAAAGLVSMGLGGGLYGFPSVFVFGAVSAGLVVWDVGTFGLGVTAELGHIPATRRLELFHAVVAVGIGVVGVAALTAVDAARRLVGSGVGTPTAMGTAVLGVVLVALLLRG